MNFIGIDPGVTGGVVALDQEGAVIGSWRTPVIQDKTKKHPDPRGMARLIQDIVDKGNDSGIVRSRVGLEKVGTTPRDGRVGAFSFGKGVGIWLGIFAAEGLPYLEVTPQRWQGKMLAGLPRGPHTKVSAVRRCAELFPDIPLRIKADHGLADAALIAEYTRLVTLAKIS
jgi:crossover junction endodeoxyribonuclease RuvC